MYSVSYTSPDGVFYQLTGGEVEILDSTLEGMTGSVKETAYTAPALPGQVVDGFEVQPMRGSMELLIGPMERAQQRAMEIRQAFDPRRPGVLAVETPLGVVTTKVRRDGAARPPTGVNGDQTHAQMTVGLISDSGVWQLPPQQYRGPSPTIVTNPGDVHVWPEFTWEGNNRGVILPSGMEVPFPQVNTPHLLYLNPYDSCLVTTPEGEVNYTAWDKMPHLAEGVPPKSTRTYTLKSGVTMTITPAILDPWR